MNPTKLQETKPTIRFSATLSRPQATEKPNKSTASSTILALPSNASAKLPTTLAPDSTMVEGTLNGFPFRAPLEPDGDASHRLRVNKALQDAAGAGVGDTVSLEITRVGEEPEIRVPADLRKALEAAPPAVLALWARITPMARRDWIRWVASAKQADTRASRIENGIDMLAHGKRRPCCFPGVNWVTKDLVASDETWLPLPSSKSRPSARAAK